MDFYIGLSLLFSLLASCPYNLAGMFHYSLVKAPGIELACKG
jgi:hypothetical protein